MHDLNGKVAIISGGAGGIGSAIAKQLAASGARVGIADLDMTRAQAVADEIGSAQAMAIHLDVTSSDSWHAARESLRERFGPCDILVSNAGVNYTGSLDTIDPTAWRWVYEVNVLGSLHAVQTFVPEMKARGSQAHVVLTCSITALHPFAQQGVYTTSKAALLNFATVLKQELLGTAIGVSALCPGIVSTELRSNAVAAQPDELKAKTTATATLSVKLGMAPEFVGQAVCDAILANQFFVFTHADYAASVRSERDLMLQAMQQSADPTYHEPELFLTPLAR